MSDATSISRRTPIACSGNAGAVNLWSFHRVLYSSSASHQICHPQVRDLLQVAWVNDEDPSQGLRYLYLEDADYQRLLTQGSAVSLKSVNAQVNFGYWRSKLHLSYPVWNVAACQTCS